MFRRDSNASFVRKGLIFQSYTFESGRVRSKKKLLINQYDNLLKLQEEKPVLVLEIEKTPKRWWMFMNDFYYEDEGYEEEEIKALALERLSKKERRVKRAMSLVEQATAIKGDTREQIPDDVKIFVWKRDGGKCVKCGQSENLEYDHIIPFSKGGSNTARNLQILCETCNRSKADSLI